MSADTPDDKGKEKKPGFLKRMIAAPKKWTIATRATVLLTGFLILAVLFCWVAFQFGVEHVPWRHYMTWTRLLGVLFLLAAIPIVFHRGVRLWLEGESARFPELEKAWQAGINALREQGITLDSAPLFVVVGSNGEQQERAIMNTNASPMSVVGVPKGPAPLHWYGNSEAIYVFCSDSSWLSALNKLRKTANDEAAAMEELVASTPTDDIDVAYTAPEQAAATPRSSGESSRGNTRGTIMLDHFVGEDAATPASTGGGSIRGTMTLDQPVASPAPAAAIASPKPDAIKKKVVTLPSRESTTRLQLLQNVCQLVRNARQPYCPVNGVLTLLPFATIDATGKELEELQRAIKADLAVVRNELQIRVPVSALVVGLEEELGFRELVRRVGREKSAAQRFGSRYDVRSEATDSSLNKFTSHVCGAFEDWVYTLFREKGALSRPGNPRLYGLLCKVRCILTNRLANILSKGFGHDGSDEAPTESTLFSGCYFASTGRTPDRQAFVQGVLEKLVSEQEQTEWTDEALSQETRYTKLFYAGCAVNAALLAMLAVLLSL